MVESTNVDALVTSMRGQIEQYRNDLLQNIELALVIYLWKEDNGSVALDRETQIRFGPYPTLIGTVNWLPQLFARIPDVPNLELKVSAATGQGTRIVTVSIPNLPEPSLQQIGIEADNAFRFRLLLKNDVGGMSASQWYEIP